MYTKTTDGITINVRPEYDIKNSFPSENRFVFKYSIEIINNSDTPIKIVSRKWLVYDVGFGFSEISGAGVVGLTPVIQPNESFSYFSNVVLRSGVGTMNGLYYSTDVFEQNKSEIIIPKFYLMANVLLN